MAETKKKSVFETLSSIDMSDKTREKNGLTYLPWAAAWAEVKKHYPEATYHIYPQIIDELGNERFWHTDGKSGWVKVGVTIEGIEQIEVLAIMNLKNQAIPAENITSTEANKAKQRCLVKACAMHGLAVNIYLGEDLPESSVRVIELKEELKPLLEKKLNLSESAKAKATELCINAVKQAFPNLEDELVTANYYKNIEDEVILSNLYDNLLAIRK